MITSPLTWLPIHAAASVWGAGAAGAAALCEGVALAGRGRPADPPAEPNAPLTTTAVTATAAAMTTAAATCQRLRSHSLIVVARTRPHEGADGAEGAASAGLASPTSGFPSSAGGFPLSLAGSAVLSGFPAFSGFPVFSGEPTFTSMLPSDAWPSSSLTVATLRYMFQRLTCHSRADWSAEINLKRLSVINA
jgi:hypothetical protein